jgi:hypothetical protein
MTYLRDSHPTAAARSTLADTSTLDAGASRPYDRQGCFDCDVAMPSIGDESGASTEARHTASAVAYGFTA